VGGTAHGNSTQSPIIKSAQYFKKSRKALVFWRVSGILKAYEISTNTLLFEQQRISSAMDNQRVEKSHH